MKATTVILPALILAQAAADTVKLEPGPFELPDRLGPMRLEGAPHKYDDPRLGASYQYSGGGLSLTIYVYDAGVTDIPDGGNTNLACEAFEGAKSDVQRAGYQDVQLKSQQLARLDPQAETPVAREAVLEYTRSGNPTVSYIWLTAAAKVLVKARFSVDPKLRDELVDARRAILTALGEAIKPHLAKVDPEKKPETVALTLAANDFEEMTTAILYLGTMSSLADQLPELRPLCGGPFVPDFATEVGAMKGLVTFAGEAEEHSKFTKRLADIDAAGFLDEFVWEFRRQESWGDVPPEGLDIAAFDQWRKKHLKRFAVPVFGHVDYRVPRPMPLEPAGQ